MNETTTIKLRLDLGKPPPPLTDEQKARLAALEAMPDSEIDLSDIPEHDFSGADVKQVAMIRVDVDVFAWLRTRGKGYQNHINDMLRREMLAEAKAEG